ncbi:hypothetical protein L1280_002465 [Deinococcus sp. HSC-46F16]|nr:hypothetical protein [Deinococcus sp. HSC-46F16]MCP2015304.1 hypothetical protein [Deinococcus sp. HSC-46F16]
MPYQWEFFSGPFCFTKEYKKVRLEFYQPEFYEWARENLGTEA